FQKGRFDMNDLKAQFEQMQSLGGMQGIMGMLPGMGKIQKQIGEAGFDDKIIKRQIAIIDSMTKEERRKPELMKASRKERVAKGSGNHVSEVNKLLKMHRQMADMMKKLGKKGKRGMMGMMQSLMGGKMPPMPGGMPPGGMPGGGAMPDPGQMPRLPGGLGGLGGASLPPGLGGLGGIGKKK
ncbi:MAG: signal recognition particle protein, partial [Pseudomonadota bacterium]